jgi:hypothetical protein
MTPAERSRLTEAFRLPVLWLFSGMIVGYLVFVGRVMFSANNVMVFDEYVPKLTPIGTDLRITLEHAAMLWTTRAPYYPEVPIPYPPLGLLILRPLAALPFYFAYRLVALGTVAAFLFLIVAAGRLVRRPASSPELWLIAAVGLISYPVQFELERGQWNVVATALAVAAVWLFQSPNDSRWHRTGAYVLMVAAVHLKIFPAVFAIGFWRREWPWRRNVLHLAGVAGMTALALAALGPDLLRAFLSIVIPYSQRPYVWFGNHSIAAFAELTGMPAWPSAAFLVALALSAFIRLVRRQDGADPLVLASVTLATLLLPSTSHDYKLSLLPFAMALVFGWLGASAGVVRLPAGLTAVAALGMSSA